MLGASRTITEQRPVLFIQQSSQLNAAQAGSLVLTVMRMGYEVFYYYSPHAEGRWNSTLYDCITLDFVAIPQERADHRHLVAGLEESPLVEFGRLRQYIRCHNRDGSIKADFEFGCLQRDDAVCYCRTSFVGVTKCDTQPLVYGALYHTKRFFGFENMHRTSFIEKIPAFTQR